MTCGHILGTHAPTCRQLKAAQRLPVMLTRHDRPSVRRQTGQTVSDAVVIAIRSCQRMMCLQMHHATASVCCNIVPQLQPTLDAATDRGIWIHVPFPAAMLRDHRAAMRPRAC